MDQNTVFQEEGDTDLSTDMDKSQYVLHEEKTLQNYIFCTIQFCKFVYTSDKAIHKYYSQAQIYAKI